MSRCESRVRSWMFNAIQNPHEPARSYLITYNARATRRWLRDLISYSGRWRPRRNRRSYCFEWNKLMPTLSSIFVYGTNISKLGPGYLLYCNIVFEFIETAAFITSIGSAIVFWLWSNDIYSCKPCINVMLSYNLNTDLQQRDIY